jgi:hypothetical protein
LSGKKRWVVSETVDGVCETRFLSVRNFHLFVQAEMLDMRDYIWRGQRCDDWTLDSTFDRLLTKCKISDGKRPEFRAHHLDQFQLAVRGRRGSNPPRIDDENGWWSLGQHHGLCTPLLDWTASPFVAAYFAFINEGVPQTDFRAIYALNRAAVEFLCQKLQAEEVRQIRDAHPIRDGGAIAWPQIQVPRQEVEFITPQSDENQRLVNQSGLFTRAPDESNMETWVRKRFKGVSTDLILRKLLVPNSDRDDCLKMLNRMNINHLTLFPDLYGASKYCNMHAEVEMY